MKNISWHIYLTISLLFTLFIQFLAVNKILPISIYYVFDSLTYELKVQNEVSSTIFSEIWYNTFNQTLYNIGSGSFFLVNFILLQICLSIVNSVFAKFGKSALFFARLSLFNPYLLFGCIGPNKETVLTFTVLTFIFGLLKLKSLSQLIIIVFAIMLTLMVRTIVCLPMFVCYFVYKLNFIKIDYRKLFFLLVISLFLINSTQFGNNIIFETKDENLNTFAQSRIYEISLLFFVWMNDPIMQIPAFLGKLIILTVLPVIRPIYLFSNPIPILDLGYNYMGFLLIPFHLLTIYAFLKYNKIKSDNNKQLKVLLLFYLVGLISCTFAYITTFRYLFPFVSLFLGAIGGLVTKKALKAAYVITGIFLVLNIFINLYYEVPSIENSTDVDIPIFMSWLR